MNSAITFDQARKIATDLALSHLSVYRKDQTIPLLEDRHLEAEHCWMFFRNPAITISHEGSLADWAYCISKRGTARSVADFSENPVQLHAYLKTMSDYFETRGL
ncbi:hypothetical protein MKD49_11840 [Herbaspirillum sp. WGmk3]|uniref:hypothetical protein n=1 Tax=Herbaspirillum sp. WGmk3 TaxID=2919925 RepID=UPI0020904F01|nr:hypothetical protein [Herbaspirillum sp. WGmk3]MCO4857171.1 hypothetical protein [Herbaspirillum sp. WGmk3]